MIVETREHQLSLYKEATQDDADRLRAMSRKRVTWLLTNSSIDAVDEYAEKMGIGRNAAADAIIREWKAGRCGRV